MKSPIRFKRDRTEHTEFRSLTITFWPKVLYCSMLPRSEHSVAACRMLFIGAHLGIHVGPVEGIWHALYELPEGSKSKVWHSRWTAWRGVGLAWSAAPSSPERGEEK